jgi:hypothetical protein
MLRYVDLDGTAAVYDGWKGFDHIGEPIPAMLEKVKAWMAAGDEIVIFTARVSNFNVHGVEKFDAEAIASTVQDWTEKHLGKRLQVTATKGPWDYACDDSIEQIVRNTGLTVQELILDQIDHLEKIGYQTEPGFRALNRLRAFITTLPTHSKP